MNGIKRGYQLWVDAIAMRARAVAQGNIECVAALDQVNALWFTEATGVKLMSNTRGAEFKVNLLAMALFGSDPFRGSREAFAGVKIRFPSV